jgi:hypothetical protein
VVAEQQGREPVEVAKEAGAELVCDTSLKVVLDQDWDQIEQRVQPLDMVDNSNRFYELISDGFYPIRLYR